MKPVKSRAGRAALLLAWAFTLAAGWGGGPRVAAAAALVAAPPPRVLVVAVEGLDLAGWLDAAPLGLAELARQGSLGLIGLPPTARQPGAAYASLAAAARSGSDAEAGLWLRPAEIHRGVTAAELYRRRLGQAAPAQGLLHPAAAALPQAAGAGVDPYALGAALARSRVRRVHIGGADRDGQAHRPAALLLGDRQGHVPRHYPADRAAATWPGGLATDWQAVRAAVAQEWRDEAPVVAVVEAGDLARLAAEADRLTPERYRELQRQALAPLTAFVLEQAAGGVAGQDLLVVLSAAPGPQALAAREMLTPVVMVGEGFAGGALLSSGTTRRPGLVSAADLAPTLLQHLGSAGFGRGRPVEGVSAAAAAPAGTPVWLAEQQQRWLSQHRLRPAFVRSYCFLQLVGLGLGLYALAIARRWARLARPWLLWLAAVPVGTWVAAAGPPPGTTLAAGAMWGLGAGAVAAVCYVLARGRWLAAMAWVATVTAAAMAAEALMGAPLQPASLLGYSLVTGARFYGLGNEHMGVLIGAALTAAGVWCNRAPWGRRPRLWALGGCALAATAVLAAPGLGANFGGALSAGAASGIVLSRLGGRRRLLPSLAAAAAVAVLAAAVFVGVDLARPDATRSHVGRVAAAAADEGAAAVLAVAGRKLALNARLMRHTSWTWVLLGAVLSLSALSYRPVGALSRALAAAPVLAAALAAAAVAALTALVSNDSGVVAAGTLLIFPAALVFFVVDTHLDQQG